MRIWTACCWPAGRRDAAKWPQLEMRPSTRWPHGALLLPFGARRAGGVVRCEEAWRAGLSRAQRKATELNGRARAEDEEGEKKFQPVRRDWRGQNWLIIVAFILSFYPTVVIRTQQA